MKQLLFDGDPAANVAVISEWKPDFIFSIGSYLRLLLEHSERLGLPLNCRTVITSGEVLDGATRSYLRRKLNADVYDHYGMEEVGGSVAWECPTHSGYHINDECVILEFLRDGEPVHPGTPGEIHITSLTRTATPIIRYATGDIATPIEEECECGRGLSMLRDIQGRISDFVATRNGRYVSPASIITRLQEAPGLDQFKVIQNPDSSIDVLVRTAKGMEATTCDQLKQVCAGLFDETAVRIIQVERIEYTSGEKFRVVESSITNRPAETQLA
jgi:phenylacetate-CoA ligase